ncbi:MAG: S8 family serine peptidase [Nitrospirota bacterium]
MKKLFWLLLVLFLFSCGDSKMTITSGNKEIAGTSSNINERSSAQVNPLSYIDKAAYREGELLVKFKSDVTATASLRSHETVGSNVIKKFTLVENLQHVRLPQGVSVKDAIVQYVSDPNVEYAEPNYVRCVASTVPNDTYFGDQWALLNTGTYASGTAGADIKATDAWDITRGNSNIVVAVVDTGIDYKHSDLVGNIWTNPGESNCANGIDDDSNGKIDDCKGWNFADNNNDPFDDIGHGTHVAGIIGAVGNNGSGISGVMWNVKLMPLKIFSINRVEPGGCVGGYVADEISAIQYAISKNAKIINASFGQETFCNSEFDAINSANSAGVLFVAAAGNGTDNDGIGKNNDLAPAFPASYNLPNIISVAATDQNDVRVPFSNFGLNSVHVAAPGIYVLSTIPNDGFQDKDFNAGTSMAAPHVVGLAGLLCSHYTNFNYSQVRGTILRYVDILPTLSGWIQTGGRINAFRAISSLLMPTNLKATATSPTKISLTWEDNATGEDGYKIERKTAGADFAQIAVLGPDATIFRDSGLSRSTTYVYRVRVFNSLPNPPGTTIEGNSLFSDEASATTPAKKDDDGGGGGCSIGMRQNTPTAMADLVVMLIPLLFIAIMRFKRKV